MDRRVILASLVAFGVALGLGRVLFRAKVSDNKPVAQNQLAGSTVARKVSDPVQAKSEPKKANDLDRFKVKTALTRSGSEAVNDNQLFTHVLPVVSTDGTTHTAKHAFGSFVHWVPGAREVWQDGNVISSAPAMSARGDFDSASKDQFLYKNTFQDVDERFTILQDGGIEHDYLLETPPQVSAFQNLAFTGFLQTAETSSTNEKTGLHSALSVWDGETRITGHYRTTHGLQLKNRFSNTVFYVRPPLAYDANVTLGDGKLDKRKQAQSKFNHCLVHCEYVIDVEETGIRLAVVTPGSWLNDPQRAYPVTIDPNLGQFGLADAQIPFYVGAQGSSSLVPAHTTGNKLFLDDTCPINPNLGYGHIPLPFDFSFYGQVHPAGSLLFVHISGFASWDPPFPKFDPLDPTDIPCNDIPNTPLPSGAPLQDNGAFDVYWAYLKFKSPTAAPYPSGDPQVSGIYWFVDGVAPNRNLNIEWYGMQDANASDATQTLSFNLILHECDSQFTYILLYPTDKDTGRATIGVNSPGGILGIQYCFDSATNGNPNNNQNQVSTGAGGPCPNTPPNQPCPQGNGQTTSVPPVTPGTALNFEQSPISNIIVNNSALTGCAPLDVCFAAQVQIRTPQCLTINNQSALPPSLGFEWDFNDANPTNSSTGQTFAPIQGSTGASAFTPTVCHTFSVPGIYSVTLTVTDQFGHKTPFGGTLTVQVCAVPTVVITATPQGGPAPLDVDFEARSPVDPNITISSTTWQIDQLAPNNEPGQFSSIATIAGQPGPDTGPGFLSSVCHYQFVFPSAYRVTAFWSGTDNNSGLVTSGVGTIFIYVSDSSMPLQDQVIITSSNFNVDLTGKLDLTGPHDNLPDNPNNDIIAVNGIFNLPNVDQSSLSGRQVRVVLNGVDPIFVGTLDANGRATQGDASTGRTGNFAVNLPSGNFHVDAKGNFMSSLGLPNLSFMQNNANLNFKNQNKTNARQMACTYEFFIDGLFPSAPLPPPMIEYVVSSRFIDESLASSSTNASTGTNTSTGTFTSTSTSTSTVGSTTAKPPLGSVGGNTVGVYRLGGKFQNIGTHTHVPVQGASNSGDSAQKIPNNIGSVAGTEFFISGGFMVTSAAMNLVGTDVFADISGVLAPPGGGQIIFDPDTDIAISLGGGPYTEVFNPSTTPGFKANKNVLSFKRSSSLGKTGIASFSLAETGTSLFRVKSFALPNEQVQIDPTQGKQTMYFSIIITPVNTGVQTLVNRYPVTGITHFSLQKSTKPGKQQGALFVH
jgi:hypothetical protein